MGLPHNVKRFNPNFIIEDWCYDRLLCLNELDNYKFYNSRIEYDNYIVPVEKIVGTTHFNYIGRTWVDLPYQMKRFHDYYTVNNFLEFVKTEDFDKNDLGYIKYGDLFFISGGNHRTCQAKFSNLKSIKAHVVEFIFDDKMFNIFNYLKNENLKPEIEMGGGGKYYRFNSWIIKLNSRKIYFKSFAAIEKFIGLYEFIIPSWKNTLLAKWSKKEFLHVYSEEKDYNHLKNSIIMHKIKVSIK